MADQTEAVSTADHGAPPGAPRSRAPRRARLAGAPISWGACEVPGWGPMPDLEAVLGEMTELGLAGTELGAPGFLPHEPEALTAALRRHGLAFVGAFVPLVLHEPDSEATMRAASGLLDLIAAAGGDVLVVAVVSDAEWSPPAAELSDAQWRQLATHAAEVQALAARRGIAFALHPHVGTLVQTAPQVQRALAETEVGWCLDTGHLVIGGTDPVAFARDHGHRVTHVHVKDVDGDLAAQVRSGDLSLLQATRRGLFRPLGQGVARVAQTLQALDEHGYDGWLVLEQDRALGDDEPRGGPSAAMRDARQSIAFLAP